MLEEGCATALEAILEKYEDGEFETLGELLDFYIDELKECPTDEADELTT